MNLHPLQIICLFIVTCTNSLFAAEPTVPPSNGKVTTRSCIDARIQWTNGNGGWRLVLIKEGAPIDADPSDGTKYTGWNAFKDAPSSEIGTGNWVVYNSISDNVVVSKLKQNTRYYVKIIEHDGDATTPDYLLSKTDTFSFMTYHIDFNFDFYFTDSCQGTNNVVFDNKSKATAPNWTTYRWRYGDGKTDTGFNIIHSFKIGGFYNVRLEAFPARGCIDNWTNPRSFFISPRPKSKAEVNDSVQCFIGHEFQFSDLTTIDPVSGCSYGRIWSLGDNQTNTMPSFKKTYAKAGTYKIHYVSETYYNNIKTGCVDSSNFTVRLIDNPSVGFSVNDSIQCFAGNSFQFDNISPNLKTFTWDLGDGATSSIKNPLHSYSSTGAFRIIHSATSVEGCSSTDTVFVWVKPEKDASWKIAKDSVCYKSAIVKLVPNSPGGKFFGTDISNDTFKPLTPGLHTIKYVYKDSFCPDSSSQDIKVISLPQFNLGPDLTICDGLPKPVSISAGNNFLWNDGDKSQSRLLINPGSYWAEAEQSNCYWRDTMVIFSGTLPSLTLPNDTLLCKGALLKLTAKWPNSKIQWSNGSTDSFMYVVKSGTYSVTISNPCGSVTDQVVVNYQDKDCDILTPTGFTPDDNGTNDVFRIIGKNNITPIRMLILNRWGAVMYDSEKTGKHEWDGKYNGEPCMIGMYTYIFQYSINAGDFIRRNSVSGVVTLYR